MNNILTGDADLRYHSCARPHLQLKGIADYLTGSASHISPEMAREAIDNAKQFVECVTALLPAPPQLDRSR
jgi:hypothetical protein